MNEVEEIAAIIAQPDLGHVYGLAARVSPGCIHLEARGRKYQQPASSQRINYF